MDDRHTSRKRKRGEHGDSARDPSLARRASSLQFQIQLSLLIGLMVLAAAQQVYAAQDDAVSSSARMSPDIDDPLVQLKKLLEKAPNRQVGQPGNDAVDQWIADTFAEAVEEHNRRHFSAERLAEVEHQLNNVMHQADTAILAATERREKLTQSAAVIDSSWIKRFTLEDPIPTIVILLLLAVLFVAGWHVQKRKSLLMVAAVSVLVAVLLPLIAAVVQTAAESTDSNDSTAVSTAQLDQAVLDAANDALQMDHAAAQVLDGLWQHGRIYFPSAAYLPGNGQLTRSDQADDAESNQTLNLYQMAPNLVEPANLPPGGFEGRIVYAGRVGPTDLEKDFTDGVAVVEFDCGKRWLQTVIMGAKVVLVLEPPQGHPTTLTEAAQKRTETPLSIPRFYVKRDAFEAVLGDPANHTPGPIVTIRQHALGRWQRRALGIDWLFIAGTEGRKPVGGKFEEDPGRQLIHIQTYKDSRSIVPTLSPGATSAANLVLLVDLIKHFDRHPPRRPVLISAVNDHTNALAGEQHYAFTAFAQADAIRKELRFLEQELARHRFIEKSYTEPVTSHLIERVRMQTAFAGGQVVKLREPAQKQLAYMRNAVRERRSAIQFKLDQGPSTAMHQYENEAKVLEGEARELVTLMGLFNRFGRKTYFDQSIAGKNGKFLTRQQQERVANLLNQIARDVGDKASLYEQAYRQLMNNVSIRRRLRFLFATHGAKPPIAPDFDTAFAMRHEPLPAIVTLALDLGFGTGRAGMFHLGHLVNPSGDWDAQDRVTRLATHAVRVADAYADRTGEPNLLIDTIRHVGGVTWQSHLGQKFALGSRPVHAYTMPGLTLTSVGDHRVRAYTPHDTTDQINPVHLHGLIRFARGYIPELIDSEGLGLTRQDRGKPAPMSVWLDVRKHDQFSSSVSEIRVPNGVVVLHSARTSLPNSTKMLGQVRPWSVFVTDRHGRTTIRGAVWRGASVMAFGVDSNTGQLNAAVDLAKGEKQFPSSMNVQTQVPFAPKSIMTFGAKKIDLIGMTEPLTLGPPSFVEVIDATLEGTPNHYSINGVAGAVGSAKSKTTPTSWDGTASIWVEPHVQLKLRVGSGLAINASPEMPEGNGFGVGVRSIPELVLRSAADLWQINEMRLELLQSKGVVDDSALLFRAQAAAGIAAAKAAKDANRNTDAIAHAQRAQGLGYRAYLRGLGTINDLIKAIVLFLMLVIPFCYFLMKLVTPYSGIKVQLALFTAIFLMVALVLRVVHPAFAVAETPTMVLLAFGIIGLAGFVAIILISRFNESMTQAIEEAQQSESTDAPQSRLAGVAFVVGVNNMKRRRIRTTLTCVTIVLVTFTMLSVISVGRDVEPTQRWLSRQTPYDGFVYNRPGLLSLNDLQIQRLRAQFRDRAQIVARAWVQRKGRYGEYLPYELWPTEKKVGAQERALKATVLLGMEPHEDGFVGPMPLLPGGRWFSADDAHEIVISAKAARFLGVTQENFKDTKLVLGARTLTLVGLVDDDALEAMRDIGDVPLLPLLTEASFATVSKRLKSEATGEAQLETGDDLLAAPGVYLAEAKDVAILPIASAMAFGDGAYRTLSFKYNATNETDSAETSRRAWEDSKVLIAFQHARIAVGIKQPVPIQETGRAVDAGQYALASSSSAEVVGVIKIMIPIILVATIILNTMLGSVMERKREVGIYNAIGLNPSHVMMFFLAESLVFGVIGSVAGYIIGQGLSLLLAPFIGLNLNYSSLAVMVVIFLSIGTVLISTIYPAMMAARASVPSGQRRWSLPQPEGDEIYLKFPFSYDAHRVMGVCAYLHEFMQQNTEASTGKFVAKAGPVGTVPVHDLMREDTRSEKQQAQTVRNAYVMVYDIAPAPFDLAVNQKMEVYAYYDVQVRAHMLSVHLTRLSGQVHSWVHVNQRFLESLRKRLLEWRSQRPENQQAYFERGEKLLGTAAPLPTIRVE